MMSPGEIETLEQALRRSKARWEHVQKALVDTPASAKELKWVHAKTNRILSPKAQANKSRVDSRNASGGRPPHEKAMATRKGR